MNVLSLFDGMSCGRVALERVGIKVDKYYASEIDKYAIQVSQNNYPDIIRLGDVNTWMSWCIDPIDLLIGGSPCQGFSFAGKQLNFDDQRSALFFQFVNCLHHFKPKYFLLENVVMKKEYQDVISDLLGVQPIMINSALVSAQNRKRLYWTNIPNVTQPEDKGIMLKDIIQTGDVGRDKAYCIDANYWKGGNLKQYFEKARRQLVFKDKSQTILSTLYKENAKSMVKRGKLGLLTGKDGCLIVPEATKQGYAVIGEGEGEGEGVDLTFPTSKTRRGRRMEDKCNALTAANYDYNFFKDMIFRKLTPIECERLQTLPDNYTEGVSNSQRYKMLGNGWTVDVIANILTRLTNKLGGLE